MPLVWTGGAYLFTVSGILAQQLQQLHHMHRAQTGSRLGGCVVCSNDAGKLGELIGHAVARRGGAVRAYAVIPLSAQQAVNGGQRVGVAVYHKVPAGPLQHHAVPAVGILGGQRGGGKAAVIKQRQPGNINAVLPAHRAVLCGLGHTQQPGRCRQ